ASNDARVLDESPSLWRQSRRPPGVHRRGVGGPDLSRPVHHLATCAVSGRRLMVEHSFGGPWTERKLKCLRDYLSAYRAIFTGNEKARYFRTWYVDAFAGTGSRTAADLPLLDIDDDAEAKEYQDG